MQHADALAEMFRAADRRRTEAQLRDDVARAKTTTPGFAKAASELEIMFKALPKPAPVLKAAVRPYDPQRGARIVTKCLDALAHNPNLNAAQRGELMLGLSRAANLFSKSHQQNLQKVERALALLKKARAAKIGGPDADFWIAKLEEAVRRGELEPADTLVLEERLNEIRRHLKEVLGHDGK